MAGTQERQQEPDECCPHRALDHHTTGSSSTDVADGARCTVPGCLCTGWRRGVRPPGVRPDMERRGRRPAEDTLIGITAADQRRMSAKLREMEELSADQRTRVAKAIQRARHPKRKGWTRCGA